MVKAINGPGISPASNEAKVTLSQPRFDHTVDLAGEFNLTGITANGARFSGGLDGGGHALRANQLGTSPTLEWRPVQYRPGRHEAT